MSISENGDSEKSRKMFFFMALRREEVISVFLLCRIDQSGVETIKKTSGYPIKKFFGLEVSIDRIASNDVLGHGIRAPFYPAYLQFSPLYGFLSFDQRIDLHLQACHCDHSYMNVPHKCAF